MERDDAVVVHLGIVTKLACSYWSRLPPHARAAIDLDDMISDAIVKLVEVAPRYKSVKAQPSTFVYTIVGNHFRCLLTHYRQQKRQATAVVPIVDMGAASAPCSRLRWLEARKAVECVLGDASDELRRELAKFFATRRFRSAHQPLIAELCRLTAKHGTTPDDFRIVFARL